MTQGRRVDADPSNPVQAFPRLQSGDYGRDLDGLWYCVPPGKEPFSWMGCLGDGTTHHKVTEHEDGTITVTPSILIHSPRTGKGEKWHGYLERGVWREC